MEDNRREHFRIPYQPRKDTHLSILIKGSFEVLDISANIRIEISKRFKFDFLQTQKISGGTGFSWGRRAKQKPGEVIRNDNLQVAFFIKEDQNSLTSNHARADSTD